MNKQIISAGNSITLSMSISGGTLPYTYKWYMNNTLIYNGYSQYYTINNITTYQSGIYYCVVTDASKYQIVGNEKDILVINNLEIIKQPISQISTIGSNVKFIVNINSQANYPNILSD